MFSDVLRQLINRPVNSHKYDFGHVLVIGGSAGMVGAPLLSARAALRSGAGLVTLASSAEVIDKLEGRVPELMTYRLTELAALGDFMAARKISVIAVGPGLPANSETLTMVSFLLKQHQPLIIDGGALSSLEGKTELLQSAANKAVIVTPHLGEFKRLVGQDLPAESSKLVPIGQDFTDQNHAILVLKGYPSYVMATGHEVYENTTGTPALATAGTGDVLTGMIAAIVAQEIEPRVASQTAVYLHGLAGAQVAKNLSVPSVIASDVIDAIPHVFRLD